MAEQTPTRRPWAAGRLRIFLLVTALLFAGGFSYLAIVFASQPVVAYTEPAGSPGARPMFIPSAHTEIPQQSVHSIGHVVEGDAVGLYAASRGNICDALAISAFLDANPPVASAWAGALRISLSDIHRFLASLTALTLRTDTAVTNHGYENGVAAPYQSVLQAGTAVLVDAEGLPRVRCFSGSPLQTPGPVASVRFEGPRWAGFDPDSITIIPRSRTEIDEFVVLDQDTGAVVTRPRATTGEADRPVNPTVQQQVGTTFYRSNAGGVGTELATPGLISGDIDRFLNDCNNKIVAWRHDARITRPDVLDVEVKQSRIFIAVIDLSGATADLPNGNPASSKISVQCHATATLKAPDGGEVQVGDSDGSSNTRSFVPTATAQWSWQVTAVKPGSHEVRLLIRPALAVDSQGYVEDPSMQEVAYVTRVNVTAGPLVAISLWVSDNWPLVVAIGTAIGASVIAAVKWFASLKEEIGKASRRRAQNGRQREGSNSNDRNQSEQTSGYL
jgi:hypothetical protein